MTSQAENPGPLAGRRILVVEDEYFLADDIVRALTALGARIVGPCGGLAEATGILDGDAVIDAAIMDINLRDEMAFPLARALRSRHIPLIFTTGYDRSSIASEFHDVRVWSKPLDIKALTRELAGMINRN